MSRPSLVSACAMLLCLAVGAQVKPAKKLWTFDHYLDYDEVSTHVRDLATRFPDRVRLSSMGKSLQGRDLWVLEITNRSTGLPDGKPALYLEGGIHGNEISSVMVPLYVAWKLVADKPGRGTRRILERNTVYIAPAVSPDSVHHFVTKPNSHWRPRFNMRPHDADGDGKADEDGYEDLNGDGEIGRMYRKSKTGKYVLEKTGRMRRLRPREAAGKRDRYEQLGREGIDNDKDGKFSEDGPGGINLNRNFPVGFKARKDFDGHRGASAGSEPETKAIMTFVADHPNIAMFLDYHNDIKKLMWWLGPDAPASDKTVYDAIANRSKATLGYDLSPKTHAGAGLSTAWAYGQRGLIAFIVELEAGKDGDDKGPSFMKAVPFQHPSLGEILLGNDYTKFAKRNPRPTDIPWQCEKNWKWIAGELKRLPRLKVLFPRFASTKDGWDVTGEVHNQGEYPTDTELAVRLGRASPITIRADGAEGTTTLAPIAGGRHLAFRLSLRKKSDSVTLIVSHPRAGSERITVCMPRSNTLPLRNAYSVEKGFLTPDGATGATNDYFTKGRPLRELGPTFPMLHKKQSLRVAVMLGEFKDFGHTIPAKVFERRFFSIGTNTGTTPTGTPAYGSVRDFYREMSFGQCDVTGKVFDWVTVPDSYATYRKLRFGTRIFSKRVKKAVLEKHGKDALDGFDMWVFLWAGNAVQRGKALWPVRLSRLKFAKDPLLPEGVIGFKSGEFHNGQVAPLGVLCHEVGHTFGMNDKYGLWAPPQPMANWCLMAAGEKGGAPSGRGRPFHMCAWCKMVIGWLKPIAIDPATPQKLGLRPVTHGPNECFRVLLRDDGSEYLLLENRRREGFHTDLPSPGLAVLHVGPRPENPKAYVKSVRLLPAHGLPSPRRGFLADVTRVAWPQKGKTSLTVGKVKLRNIRLVDDVAYFEVGLAR